MNDDHEDRGAATSAAPPSAPASPAPSPADLDPLAAFEAPPEETSGIWVEVEDPRTGDLLMKFKVARFGGTNNAVIVREERKLKSKLPQGQRRAIDNQVGDPEIVQRLNRQLFVRVSCLDWEMTNPKLKERWGAFTQEKADELFEAYPRVYDLVSELAVNEETYATDRAKEQSGN